MNEYLKQTYTKKEIDNFISSNAEESINLDFKRGDALRKGATDKEREKIKSDIAKDVSAFANSDGGIIVYGIEEKNHKADSLHFVDGNEFTKEMLEQIINTRIQRKIDGLIIDPIRYNNKIEQTIYVVKIPRSINAPHITSDKKFYRRYNFESVAMEEYEIRNLYSRTEKTKLKIVPPIVTGGPTGTQGNKYISYQPSIQFNVINEGQTIEKLYKLEIRIPRLIAINSDGHGIQLFFKHLVRHEETHTVFVIPNTIPLFQNDLVTMGTAQITLNRNTLNFARTLPVITKLFYSNGIEEHSFMLLDHLKGPNNETLTEEHFVDR